MSTWYHKFPKRATAADLLNKALVLLDEIPPEETRFGGMRILTVAVKGKAYERYRLMMTEREIGQAVQHYIDEGQFSVVPTEEGYVQVVEAPKG